MTGFTIISISNKYKDIVDCLDHGRATTREVIILEKNKVTFEVYFNYSFTYDYSNGINADEPRITKIAKSTGNEPTAAEKGVIEYIIKQNYK